MGDGVVTPLAFDPGNATHPVRGRVSTADVSVDSTLSGEEDENVSAEVVLTVNQLVTCTSSAGQPAAFAATVASSMKVTAKGVSGKLKKKTAARTKKARRGSKEVLESIAASLSALIKRRSRVKRAKKSKRSKKSKGSGTSSGENDSDGSEGYADSSSEESDSRTSESESDVEILKAN